VRWQEWAAGFGGASVVVLAAALWRRRAWAVPAAVLLSGAAYGVALVGRDPAFDSASILVGALLLVVAELGFWSLELATPVSYGVELLTRRVALVAVLGLGSLCAAAAVGAAAAQDAERSLLLEGLGVAAAIAVVALIARLAARRG
jgi:hypothetical protein